MTQNWNLERARCKASFVREVDVAGRWWESELWLWEFELREYLKQKFALGPLVTRMLLGIP
jgi:hypothetical protein